MVWRIRRAMGRRHAGGRDREHQRFYARGHDRPPDERARTHHPDVQTSQLQHHRAHVHAQRPQGLHQPWTVHDTWALEPETKLLEYACMENNRAFYEGASSRSSRPTTWTKGDRSDAFSARCLFGPSFAGRRRRLTAALMSGSLVAGVSGSTGPIPLDCNRACL